MAAEGARESDAVDRFDAEALHQQVHPGVQRGLGELDGAYVGLRDAQRSRAAGPLMHRVGERAALRLDARAARGECAIDHAVLADDAGKIHFRYRFDDAGTADAGDAGGRDRRGEHGIVRPQLAADHLETRLERRRIDAQPLDGARRGALAATDLRALERRSRRAGAGEQAMAVAEHDLGVGAYIDQQRHFVRQIGPLGQDDARRVGTDMTGDARQHVDARVGVDREIELARP